MAIDNNQAFALGTALNAIGRGYDQRSAARDYATDIYQRIGMTKAALDAERARQAVYDEGLKKALAANVAVQGADARGEMAADRAAANAKYANLISTPAPDIVPKADAKAALFEAMMNAKAMDEASRAGDAVANIRSFNNAMTDRGFNSLANTRDIDQLQNFMRGSKGVLQSELGLIGLQGGRNRSGIAGGLLQGGGTLLRDIGLADWDKLFPQRTTSPSATGGYDKYLPNVTMGQGKNGTL